MTETDVELLERFAATHDEGAFAEVVRRHLGLVYATALRRLGGDTHLAQDVAQAVFTDLARKAPAVAGHRVLGGWLHTSTVFAAAKVVRAEQRRRRREEAAHAMQISDQDHSPGAEWSEMRPLLDGALQRLAEKDRDALVLRFFENRGFDDIAAQLQTSAGAARMRVERALEKLRVQLARRGVHSTAAALALTLSTNALAAPPAGLALAVTGAALSGAASGAGAMTVFGVLAMTKIQLGITATLLAAGLGTIGVQRHERSELRTTVEEAAAPSETASAVRAGIARLSQQAGEVAALRAAAAERERVQEETAALRERWRELEARRAAPRNAARNVSGAPEPGSPYLDSRELDSFPQPVTPSAPVYPSALHSSRIPGEVRLALTVNAEGEVVDVELIDATHPEFALAAVEAVQTWTFKPAQKGGVPVGTRVVLPISFTIADSTWF